MATEILNISLPTSLREYIEERVQSGDYDDTSEFISELVREHQQAQDRLLREELTAKLLTAAESLDRGEGEVATPEYWQAFRQEARADLEAARRRDQ